MKGVKNEIDSELAGASLRGKRSTGTLRILWQSNSYDRFRPYSYVRFGVAFPTPAPSRPQFAAVSTVVKGWPSAL